MNSPSEVVPVRSGCELDWAALDRFLRDALGDLHGPFTVAQFSHGAANLTFRVGFGDRYLVVRRPPFGSLAPGAHDMRREYRALSRLWRSYPRAPRAYLHSDDHSIIGSDFVVLEYRSGVVIWDVLPESMRSLPDAGRRLGFAVVDAMADLHLIDPAENGLADLGRPDGFLARQVAGWRQRWQLVATQSGDDTVVSLGERLAETMPRSPRPAVLHNDFKIDNCQFDRTSPDTVTSVFDWDMATVGDPLVDLGTLLGYWPDPADSDEMPRLVPGLEWMGLPSRSEITERYAARANIDVDHVGWYEAYGCWKTAIILQQLYARHLRGETADERMASHGRHVRGLACRGLALVRQHPRTQPP